MKAARRCELRFYQKLPFVFTLEADADSVEVEVLGLHYDNYSISRFSEVEGRQHTFISTIEKFMRNFEERRSQDKMFVESLEARCLQPFKLSDFFNG